MKSAPQIFDINCITQVPYSKSRIWTFSRWPPAAILFHKKLLSRLRLTLQIWTQGTFRQLAENFSFLHFISNYFIDIHYHSSLSLLGKHFEYVVQVMIKVENNIRNEIITNKLPTNYVLRKLPGCCIKNLELKCFQTVAGRHLDLRKSFWIDSGRHFRFRLKTHSGHYPENFSFLQF